MPRGTVSVMTLVRRELQMVKHEAAPAEAAPAEGAAPSRVRSFVASSEAVDSYNTVIKSDAWDLERFTRNPVILFGHASRELPIGKGSAGVKSKQLMLEVDFFDAEINPMAESAIRILDAGVMGVSVGFAPLEWEYNEERETGDAWMDAFFPPLDYTRVELLEVSVVTIPANPDAFPVGREAVQRRFLERLDARRAPVGPTPEQQSAALATFVERIVRESRAEQQSAELRRRGKTSRS